ncbi:MAG: sialate O-acetylesterase [Planctomycetes bacterium]|nr:sialate O-acetylesterase [Planctomycetota bacterium]
MVLQRNKRVHIWGWSQPADTITIRFANQVKTVTVPDAGAWNIELDSMEASFTGRQLRVQGPDNQITLQDVLVGEVWLCGGQSNMEMKLRASRDADVEMDCADDSALRYIRLPKTARFHAQTDFPVTDTEGRWQACVLRQAENCTGVGYYFGRRLRRRLKVPVGLIDTSWGGTMAQHWVPQATLKPFDEMKRYFDEFQKKQQAWIDGGLETGAQQRFQADLKAWETARDQAQAQGKRVPGRPNQRAYANPAHQGQPGGMFNGMIAPLAGLTLRGVLFYQGENNSFGESWKPFAHTFPAVVATWRQAFRQADLPFGIIQIAGWSNRRTMTYDMNHHTNVIRELQFLCWRTTPHTGLIVTFDTNSNGSIHPARKLPVGERSARWALSEVYQTKRYQSNEALEWQGPIYDTMEILGDKIVVTFVPGTNNGLRLDQDDDPGFYIAGQDRTFVHARARVIKDNRLEIFSDLVTEPVAVRYGWSNLPVGGLMNGRELPAYPFRSDTWPLVPHQSTGAYEVKQTGLLN